MAGASVTRAVSAGLVEAIPLPFVTSFVASRIRRGELARIAEDHGALLEPEAAKLLVASGGTLVASYDEAPSRRLFRDVAARLSRLAAIDEAAYGFALARCFARYLELRSARCATIDVDEARRFRVAVDRTLAGSYERGLARGLERIARAIGTSDARRVARKVERRVRTVDERFREQLDAIGLLVDEAPRSPKPRSRRPPRSV